MIECSGCLTWLHMSCAKVKRKNIPEFYYCESCKLIT
jgi:PHD-finger